MAGQEEAGLTHDEPGRRRLLARETTALLCPPVPQIQPEGDRGDQAIQKGRAGMTASPGNDVSQALGKATSNPGADLWVTHMRRVDSLEGKEHPGGPGQDSHGIDGTMQEQSPMPW